MRWNKEKLFYLFLLLQPWIDLITGVTTKYEIGFISIGVIIRGLFILVMLSYLFIFSKGRDKKKSIIYVLLIGGYGLIYFISKGDLFSNRSFLLNDFMYIFKYVYFLLLFITCLNFYREYKLDRSKLRRVLVIDLLTYSLLILIPFITNTSFASYAKGKGEGIVGWFYAANDISAILIILFPFLLYETDEKFDYKRIIEIVLVVLASFLIGTKVAYFGIIFSLIGIIIYYLSRIRKDYKKLLVMMVILGITILCSGNISVIKNIKHRNDKYDQYQESGVNEKVDLEKDGVVIRDDDSKTSIVIFSSRDRLLGYTFDIYKKSSSIDKWFGIGFSNRKSINDVRIEKLIEMDFFDILFHGGIVAVLLYCVPFGLVIISFIKYLLAKKKITLEGWVYGYVIILGFGVSILSGHVFSSPSVVMYYGLFPILFLDGFMVKKKLKRRVTFLLLHLGQGGIEKATVDLANGLVDKIDVELVVIYKNKELLYNIDKRIKIKYLIDNDVAFRTVKYKELLKQKNGKVLKESLKNDYDKFGDLLGDIGKSLKVVLAKKRLMRKYIEACDSETIIATRVELSCLLSTYGNLECNKIAVEHRHHNHDQKYIKMISKGYSNINYLVVLTESLKNDYCNFVKNNARTRVVTIPNMLNNYPSKTSMLHTNNIISIGRVTRGKRIDEIIEIAAVLKDNNFIIVGDGDKLLEMKQLVKEKNLSNVTFTGFVKNEEALKMYYDVSLFIMTSETEGLPMALLEAFSYGVPVVAYETESGVSDIVDDGVNGYIIKNRNQKEMIAKIKVIMSDKQLRKRLGEAARQKAFQFEKDKIVEKWLEIL